MDSAFTRLAATAAIALSALFAHSAHAQATIDQTKALAGNVTPGDTAGFPITISQPGSYKLMSNLFVPAGTNGIDIAANDVTIDLNGFSIVGVNTCTQDYSTYAVSCTQNDTSKGVSVSDSKMSGMVVRNGRIRGFSSGIYIAGSNNHVEDMNLSHHSYAGLVFASSASSSLVRDVISTNNRSYGILASYGAITVTNCIASRNGSDGFFGNEMVCIQCQAAMNGQHGFISGYARESRAANNKVANFASTKSLGGNIDGTVSY